MYAALLLAATQVFFDDFSYSTHAQMKKHGWIVRAKSGWPGNPEATFDPKTVTFTKNGTIQLTISTDGNVANTRQAQICHERKYLEGTYASRVRFTDDAISGPDADEVVQTFYMISPLREPMAPEYSEMDFEYLPNGGWGRKGATFFATTWESFIPEPNWKADNESESKSASFAGWHTLVIQVANGEVRYFVDGQPFATHGGKFFPESPMSINFNHWFTRHGVKEVEGTREYREEIDWVFHAANTILSPGEVEKAVAKFRKKKVRFRDTVPDWKPLLASPCDL